jgi:ketosteroid isomerase-like protein
MSGEHVDIIRRLLPANAKSQEECLPYLAPDLEIIPMDHFPDRTIFRGPSGWERWSTRWTSMFDEHELTIGRTWETGDQVVVELSERVKSAGSSFPLVNEYAHVWTFRNGLVTRLEIFRQLEDAFAAAGMSPS